MRYSYILPLAALARAVQLPYDAASYDEADQVVLNLDLDLDQDIEWLRNAIPIDPTAILELEGVFGAEDSDLDSIEALGHELQDDLLGSTYEDPHHPSPDLTIYQIISESNHTTKFAKLVEEYDDLVKLLNSTKANHTLFVPIDEAFKHVPEDKKPSKEFIENVIRYHIGDGLFDARRFITSRTAATILKEKWLGDKPQRVRVGFGLGGARVNFYSKVIAANIRAKNGIIHAVNALLVPPPMIGRELSLLPDAFSTLLHAYEKTDFVSYIHGVKMSGSTVFAPTNRAFAYLGPRVNAFLFNTEKGLKFLKALLKYQIVANTTLYSDEIYESGDSEEHADADEIHVNLPTLLGDKKIAVDARGHGIFFRMRVNGRVPVVIRDFVGKNGVIQVVGRVPIPPHKRHGHKKPGHKRPGHGHGDEDEIDVEDLKQRLVDYLDDEDVPTNMGEL